MKNKNLIKKIGMKAIVIMAVAFSFVITQNSNVFAADDPLSVINNLSNFLFGLIKAVGMIMIGLAIVQLGMSLKSHDPSQRANGIWTLAGGIIITFAKSILDLIVG